MDYDKLTDTLRQHGVSCVRAYGRYCSICDEAATALSTLQAENEKLRAENIRWGQVASEQDKAIDNLRKELEWKDMVIELAQRKQQEAEAALRREQDG